MAYRRDLWELAAEHHGIVTTHSASDAGVPAVEVRKLAARGALQRLAHGVYRHTEVPCDQWTELAAALAAAGGDAFLEGDTVLAMFDLALVNPPTIHIGTRRRPRRSQLRTTTVTFRSQVLELELTRYEGLRSVTVHRALIEGVGHLLGDRVLDAAVEARRRDLIDERESREVVQTLAARERELAHGR